MNSHLKDEIRQTRSFESPQTEAFLNLQRTADALLRGVEELLKPYGLTQTQYNALRILRGAGSQGPLCREVGARMVTRDPDVTRLLHRLESRGLIERSRDLRDRRIILTCNEAGVCPKVAPLCTLPVQEASRIEAQASQVTCFALSEPEEGHARRPTAVGSGILAADEAACPAYPLQIHRGLHYWMRGLISRGGAGSTHAAEMPGQEVEAPETLRTHLPRLNFVAKL